MYARRGDGGAGIHAALTVLVDGCSAGMCVFFGVDMCAGQVRADDSDRARAGGADSGLMVRRRVWATAAWRATVTGKTRPATTRERGQRPVPGDGYRENGQAITTQQKTVGERPVPALAHRSLERLEWPCHS